MSKVMCDKHKAIFNKGYNNLRLKFWPPSPKIIIHPDSNGYNLSVSNCSGI